MVEVTPPLSRPAGFRWRAALPLALRWGLPVLWVLWASLAWWVEPREATQAQLDRDLGAGRVVTFQRAEGWSDDDAYWGSRPRLRYGTYGGVLAWTVPSGQVRYAFVDPPAADPSTAEPDPSPNAGQDARLAAVADPWQAGGAAADRLTDAAGLLAGLLTVLWLGRLIGGAPPVAGTRWFWFWVGLLPFGTGVLAWTYRELWRPPSEQVRERSSGWRGLGWLILAGVGIAIVVFNARRLLGPAAVPG